MVRPEKARRLLASLNDALSDLRRYRQYVTLERLRAERDTQNMVMFAFYVASQAAIDLGFHALADAEGHSASAYQDVFGELAKGGLLDAALATRLAGWARFRNVIAHHYPIIDYEKVHAALANDLGDLETFVVLATEWIDAA